ncbi:helix-turn-helix domain-containing protein [Embleya sp. MST-111070]|uniref:helix-turn-helix domain-containing protein n=1 Tax=Embleya sp. MST-111070 TaxID=3398231 RepID=UPI003F7330F7
MAARRSTTVRGRRLARELRRLRIAAGLTGEQAAERLAAVGGAWSHTKISRIENRKVGVHHGDVRDLLDVYGVTDEDLRRELVTLARNRREIGWWYRYRDVLPRFLDNYVDLENSAGAVRAYQGQLIPGFHQTRDYAAALIRAHHVDLAADDIDRLVDLRMQRQDEMTKRSTPLERWVVIDEVALLRPVGGADVFRAQLARLIDAAESPNSVVQILPLAVGEHPALDTPFTILEFPDPEADPPVVYLEHLTSAWFLEDPDEIRAYGRWFDHLMVAALDQEKSKNLIATRMKDLA